MRKGVCTVLVICCVLSGCMPIPSLLLLNGTGAAIQVVSELRDGEAVRFEIQNRQLQSFGAWIKGRDNRIVKLEILQNGKRWDIPSDRLAEWHSEIHRNHTVIIRVDIDGFRVITEEEFQKEYRRGGWRA